MDSGLICAHVDTQNNKSLIFPIIYGESSCTIHIPYQL